MRKLRKGLLELRRSEKGNTYISTGLVRDFKKIGCPECDTIYLQLFRDDKQVLLMCVTEEEACLIGRMLISTVYGGKSWV